MTLALRFVLPDLDLVSLLDDMLKSLKQQGFQIACLFLDKGFASIAVMDYLTRQAQPALIACPIRGKTGGTRALCHGRRSYRATHTFVSGDQTFTANVAVCRSFTTAKRTKRLKRRVVWLLYVLIHLDLAPRQARREYRKRFGIESSYRCAGQVRGWTTSPNPAYRFVLLTLSFVLLNIWVHLRWLYAQGPRRGRRWLKTKLFELGRLTKFIRRALERQYGGVATILAVAAPRL